MIHDETYLKLAETKITNGLRRVVGYKYVQTRKIKNRMKNLPRQKIPACLFGWLRYALLLYIIKHDQVVLKNSKFSLNYSLILSVGGSHTLATGITST